MYKQLVVGMLVLTMAVMSAGCFGSFNLTKKVYKFNDGMNGKWVKEIVFLAMNIIPVYPVAGGIDVIILNTIEFWTGSNPVAANITSDDGTQVAFNAEKKEMTISYADKKFVVAMENGKATVKNDNGEAIAYVESTDDGGMMIKDMKGNILSQQTSEQVAALLASK